MELTADEYICSTCSKRFSRKDALVRHEKIHNQPKVTHICEQEFLSKRTLIQHKRTVHSLVQNLKRKVPTTDVPEKRIKADKNVLNMFKTLIFYPEVNEKNDQKIFHDRLTSDLVKCLQDEVQENAIKWYLVEKVCLIRIKTETGEEERIYPFFRSCCRTSLTEENLELHLKEDFGKIVKHFEDFMQNGSGWTLEKIVHLELNSAKYHPLAASSYIPLPKKLAQKKAVLNIQNEDQKCFLWCLLAYKYDIHWKDHPHRVSHYQLYENEVKMDNINYPVTINQVPVIEKMNNIRINVFGYENDEVCPLYVSPKEDEAVINLLLISNEGQKHYCLIRNFSRLLGNLTKHHSRSFYCYRCLHRFSREDLLKDHLQYCKQHTAQAIKMPETDKNMLTFSAIHLQHPVGYVIYADFESLIIPIASATPSSQTSFTEKIASHVPCGYAYVIVGPDGHSIKPVSVYRGENAVEHFLDSILKEKEELELKLKEIKPMQLTKDEEKAFKEASHCALCKKVLEKNRVRDHCHLTGRYRGALHAECNLNYKQPKSIPVIFHNLKNYDGHHIMTKLGKYKDYELNVIAQTMEKYITFRLIKRGCAVQLIFLDSFQFLPASLDKLVKNLDPSQFNILKENFSDETSLSLLTRKGVYPYDYFSSHEKFNEKKLPPPSAFYNTLTEESIADEDYEHVQKVWKIFKMNTLGDYHDLYVKTDVLLLADIFQNFRNLCMQYYEIDSAHLFTSPGLAWQACLKMTGQTLELLTDIDMLLMIEQGIRGGISMISQRFARANNPYLSDYNAKEASSYIMYWDANNLYGYAMSQFLPYGEFNWYPVENITEAWIHTLEDESNEGYIFEVDLEYPEHLHDLHNDYPVAPERMTVEESMLSPFAKNMLNNEHFVGTSKLIPNLYDKKNYVTHYRNLKLYLQLGLKLKTVHKALKFKQAPWLKKYILFNTDKRKHATTSFEKDFFKLLNNSVFGKTMENLRKRRNIELCNNQKRGEKLVAASTFKGFKTFNEGLVAVERQKPHILMNRPIYVGFAILELSKTLMYEFHYNFIKKIYNSKAKLLFTDTDSLTYHITTPDIYQDMYQNLEMYDTSDYPRDHPLYSEKNKKVIGKMKDELNGKPIEEFVGLKAKMYSIKSAIGEKKTAKGVSTHTVRTKITHESYVNCLQNLTTNTEKQMRIEQENHNIYSIKQNKIALSPFDDKRYILDDGITSYAYGHCKICEN